MAETKNQYQLVSKVVDSVVTVAKTLIWAGTIIWLGSYAKEVLIAFAGRNTSAMLTFEVIAKLGADRWFAYIVGATGAAFGLVQRQLRRGNIERMASHSLELETIIDPARTSSGLMRDGRTRMEDR